jgi:hypothetical protein
LGFSINETYGVFGGTLFGIVAVATAALSEIARAIDVEALLVAAIDRIGNDSRQRSDVLIGCDRERAGFVGSAVGHATPARLTGEPPPLFAPPV